MSRRIVSTVVCSSFALILLTNVLPIKNAIAREWSSLDGKFRIEGALVSVEDSVVSIRNTNDRIVKVPLNRLSKLDQGFVRDSVRNAKAIGADADEVSFHDLTDRIRVRFRVFFETPSTTQKPELVRLVFSFENRKKESVTFLEVLEKGSVQDMVSEADVIGKSFRFAKRLSKAPNVNKLVSADDEVVDDFGKVNADQPRMDWKAAVGKVLGDWVIRFRINNHFFVMIPELSSLEENGKRLVVLPVTDSVKSSGFCEGVLYVDSISAARLDDESLAKYIKGELKNADRERDRLRSNLDRTLAGLSKCPNCNGSGKQQRTLEQGTLTNTVNVTTCKECSGARYKTNRRVMDSIVRIEQQLLDVGARHAVLEFTENSLPSGGATPEATSPFASPSSQDPYLQRLIEGDPTVMTPGILLGIGGSIEQQDYVESVMMRFKRYSAYVRSTAKRDGRSKQLNDEATAAVRYAVQRFQRMKTKSKLNRQPDLAIFVASRIDGELRIDLPVK